MTLNNLEKNQFGVSIIIDSIGVFFQAIALVHNEKIWIVLCILLNIFLFYFLYTLNQKNKKLIDLSEKLKHENNKLIESNQFILFLFFGSEYNGFHFFPKLKLYMDYLGKKNQVDIETLKFEYINNENCACVTWTMINVHNNTINDIESYYLYTANDLGDTDGVQIEMMTGTQYLNINTERISKTYGVQEIPFTFYEPIKPNSVIPEIKINMKMSKSSHPTEHDIVILYPRNYGSCVKHIEIIYKTQESLNQAVFLHEIKKDKEKFTDEPIRNVKVVDQNNGIKTYYCFINEANVGENSLYYLLIKNV